MRALTVVLALASSPSMSSCVPVLACTEEARSSLTLTVKDADGALVTTATGRWTVGTRSEACESFEPGRLVCGFEVEGEMSVEVAAPGFETTTVTATILADECHVIGQQQDVTLARSPHFDEDRRYVHAFFATQQACDDAQPEGFFVNCCATATFRANGAADVMLTDIMNAGTYVLGDGVIDFTRVSPGDAPASMRFTIGADSTLTDDASQWTWRRLDTGGCF